MTTRGMGEADMLKVAALVHRAVAAAQRVIPEGSKLVDFIRALDNPVAKTELALIRQDVVTLASSFPLPGVQP
jgi:glycine/serine hydroxymethyltransferase